MEKPPGTETVSTRVITVLSVSPIDEDCAALAHIFNDPNWTTYTRSKWKLLATATIESALTALQHNRIPIVLCENDLLPGSWIDMLEQLTLSADPPYLIVTSRLADDRLWADALNRGAYDVLAKPFDRAEVVRIVSLAWLHWKAQHEPAGMSQAWTPQPACELKLPTSGKVGAVIRILGSNLTGATSVGFNDTAAAFTIVSFTEITATVPAGATTGMVKVRTPYGTLLSNLAFRVRP